MARLDEDAAGRLLEGVGDRAPREMTVRMATIRQNPAYRPVARVPDSLVRAFARGCPLIQAWRGQSMRFTAMVAVLLGAGVAACSRVQSGGVSGAGSPISVATPEAAPTALATFRYAPGRVVYDYVATATVALQNDTAGSPEPVRSRSRIAVTLERRDARLDATVIVDSVSVTAGGRITADSQPLPEALIHSAHVEPSGRVVFDEASAPSDCSAAAAGVTLSMAREVLLAVPKTLDISTTWRDTVHATSCRGGVTVRTTTQSTFSVEAIEQSSNGTVARIARRGTIAVAGEGLQRGQAVRLSGSGQVTGHYLLHAGLGRLMQASAEYE